jgi:hypothetical protein
VHAFAVWKEAPLLRNERLGCDHDRPLFGRGRRRLHPTLASAAAASGAKSRLAEAGDGTCYADAVTIEVAAEVEQGGCQASGAGAVDTTPKAVSAATQAVCISRFALFQAVQSITIV